MEFLEDVHVTEMEISGEVDVVHAYLLFLTSPHSRWSAESWLFTSFYDIGLTHIDLLHKGGTELVEFLV